MLNELGERLGLIAPPPTIDPPISSQYMVVRFHRSDPVSCGLFPSLIKRIEQFCIDFDTDTPPKDQSELAWGLFARGDIQCGIWGIVNREYDLVAHLFVTPEPLVIGPIVDHPKYRYSLIRQAQVDKGVNILPLAREVFQEVKQWSEKLDIFRIIGLTHRGAESLARRWGLHKYKTLVEHTWP